MACTAASQPSSDGEDGGCNVPWEICCLYRRRECTMRKSEVPNRKSRIQALTLEAFP